MANTPRPVADGGLTIGEVLLGKYRVDALLGQGGMGVVAKCTHLGLNEHVAIKMLRQDVLLDRDATERFMREAQSASKLKSEHVARVVDVGTFDTGVPYMVMEFLDGHDLGDLVDDRGPLQAPFAAMLMLQAAEALAEAHSLGIVHRDVKPSNLFVSWRPDGSALVKVLDFGISKAPSGTDMKLTQTQSLLGTPAYMSPEQMRSARLVDARTDIWSLGTVFYELLEGRRPFEAESFSEMCVKVAVDPPLPMVNTPPALQAIILRCLAKSPDQRYASMAELGRDLLPHVQDVHQASLLVERMQRVLGRARSSANAEGWESSTGPTGVGGRQVRADSAPVAVPWHGGSDPLATPTSTPSPFAQASRSPDPRAPAETLREESKPARALSEVLSVPQPGSRKRRLGIVVLSSMIVIGVGVVVLFASNVFDRSESNAAVGSDHVQPASGSTTASPVSKPDLTKPDETNPTTGTVPNTAEPKTPEGKDGGSAAAAPIEIEPDVATKSTKPKPRLGTNRRPPPTQLRRPTGEQKDTAKTVKNPPPDEGSAKPVTAPPPATGTCKVWERLPSTNKCPGEK